GVTMLQQANYYNVNGIVLNPQDWEAIETAKGSDGHYIWVNVQNGGTQQLWRIPVSISNSMQAGDFLMGDFTMGAALYNREGITIRTSESHVDLFARNGVAILAELRAGLGVELPKAFVKCTVEATAYLDGRYYRLTSLTSDKSGRMVYIGRIMLTVAALKWRGTREYTSEHVNVLFRAVADNLHIN